LFLGAGSLSAQSDKTPDLSKKLYVGDTFKAPRPMQVMRSATKKIDWKKLEGKVVLLDFFDTFCGTCIQTMPKLQKLKDQYPDKFEVITVTWQDKATMDKFFASNAYLRGHRVDLPIIYGDVKLKELFPHRMVPHAVLLFKGRVQAITSSTFISPDNILKLFNEGRIDLPLKDDFGTWDLSMRFTHEIDQLKMGTQITGYQDGVPYRAWTFELDSVTGLYKSSLYNASIYTALLGLSAKANVKKSVYIPRMDRVVWKVGDSTKYHNFTSDPEWRLRNAICYERFDTICRSDSLQARVIMEDFAGFYGLRVFSDMRKMKVLVLRPTEVKPYDAPLGAKGIVYRGSAVFAGFTDLTEKFPPIVDLVKSDAAMRIFEYDTLEELNRQLAACGIKAELDEEEIEVFVIAEI
jgi:thiol-disulfide isomerase/thioredoxin